VGHGLGERRELLLVESRLRDPALPAPEVAFAGEQAVPEEQLQRLEELSLRVVPVVVDEDVSDRVGVREVKRLQRAERQADDVAELVEVPHLHAEGVAPELGQNPDEELALRSGRRPARGRSRRRDRHRGAAADQFPPGRRRPRVDPRREEREGRVLLLADAGAEEAPGGHGDVPAEGQDLVQLVGRGGRLEERDTFIERRRVERPAQPLLERLLAAAPQPAALARELPDELRLGWRHAAIRPGDVGERQDPKRRPALLVEPQPPQRRDRVRGDHPAIVHALQAFSSGSARSPGCTLR
jgi:hypothetical protein